MSSKEGNASELVNPLHEIEWGSDLFTSTLCRVGVERWNDFVGLETITSPNFDEQSDAVILYYRRLSSEVDLDQLLRIGIANISYKELFDRVYRKEQAKLPLIKINKHTAEPNYKKFVKHDEDREAERIASTYQFWEDDSLPIRSSNIVDSNVMRALTLKIISDSEDNHAVGLLFASLYTSTINWSDLKNGFVNLFDDFVNGDSNSRLILNELEESVIIARIFDWLIISTLESSYRVKENISEPVYPYLKLKGTRHDLALLPDIYKAQNKLYNLILLMSQFETAFPYNKLISSTNRFLGVPGDRDTEAVLSLYETKIREFVCTLLGEDTNQQVETVDLVNKLKDSRVEDYTFIITLLHELKPHIEVMTTFIDKFKQALVTVGKPIPNQESREIALLKLIQTVLTE